ncbi:glycoside hydrolase family 32 protein [Pedococcus sp. KACC 23699]|uniref:beta-fructofuranosidase n=1 Tax=Pedococcus sp. KACC 23699 TaxID=3149228 RepID=A0AAU7JNT2_9MICO
MSNPEPSPSLVALAEADRHRPRFHFVSPAGWLNDPNGLTHREGTYHLFYQYNPTSALHSRIHWGHATSSDLVRWVDQPVALIPGDEGPDRDGCWSGALVDDGGTPTIVYSGRHGDREMPCVATGSADLNTWTKDPGNPVIDGYPEGLEVTAYRDHCVWREGGRWRQLVGSGIVGKGGTALLYESTDLRSWDYVGPLVTGDASTGTVEAGDWTGTMWECVDLFRPPPAQDRDAAEDADPVDVLVFSAWDAGVTHYPLYWTGTYSGDAFVPCELHRLDYGGRYFYAPQSFRDSAGRRLVFGWLQEGRTDEAMVAAGWSGVMSLPRVITLGVDGALVQAPAPEVATLRRDGQECAAQTLTAAAVPLGEGDQRDLEVTAVLAPGSAIEVALATTPDAEEVTVLRISRTGVTEGRVELDRSRSSLDPTVDATPRSGPVPISSDGEVELRVLVDHSALEVFVNGRALTARIYPTREDATGASVSAVTGSAELCRATTWAMRDTWAGPRQLYP